MRTTSMRKVALFILAPAVLMGAATIYTSEQVNYRFPGTGAAVRRLTARLADTISVADWCTAKGNGEDDTTCLQAAVTAAAGKTLYFPRPVSQYKVSGTIVVTGANTKFLG